MKKIIYFFLLFLLFSCNDEFEVDYSDGISTALMNESNWKGQIKAFKQDNDNIFISMASFDDYGNRRESFTISNIPYRLVKSETFGTINDEFPVLPLCIYRRVIDDGDVISETYYLDIEKSNFVELTKIDSNQNYVEGEFELFFDLFGDKYMESAPDNVYFTNGSFNVFYE